MKFSFAFLSDLLFTAFISFVLCFVGFAYFLPRNYSVIFSSLLAVIFSILFFITKGKKDKTKYVRKKEQRAVDQTINEIQFLPKSEIIRLFERAFKNKNIPFERKRNGILHVEKNTVYLFKFGFETVTKADVLRAYNSFKNNKVNIFSESFSSEVKDFSLRFNGNAILTDKRGVYEFLKSANSLPEISSPTTKENKLKRAVEEFFKVKKARKYLAFGLLFLTFSFFTVYKLYYVVFGGVLLLFSLLCRIFGSPNERA